MYEYRALITKVYDGDTLLITTTRSAKLYALDKSGNTKWTSGAGGAAHGVAVDKEGRIYFGTSLDHNRLYAFDKDGSQAWVFNSGGEIGGTPD